MVNNCVSVNLSREDATYNAGDVISGVISVTTAHKLTVKGRKRHFIISFHNYTSQHQQADDFGRWGVHAEGVMCGKIGKVVK